MKRGTPLPDIVQDDIAQLVRPESLPPGFSWDNIEDIAIMLGKAWGMGYAYGSRVSSAPPAESTPSRMPCGCPIDSGCSGWHTDL